MKLMVRQILFIFSFFLSGEIYAQSRDVKFSLVTGNNGITLGKVNGIVRDKYGFLWFSDQSNRCIVRFDGNHMVRYQNDPRNSNSLGGFYPECLASDSSGNIWIGFYGMGLDKFDPVANSFTHYRHSDNDPASLSNDFVSTVLVDHLGNVWVGNHGGLDLLDEPTGKFKHFRRKANELSALSCDTVRVLYEDKAGELWVGTGFPFDTDNPNGGLNLFHRDKGSFSHYMHDPRDPSSLIANKVRAIFEDSYGNFWVGTDGDGLHIMDRKTGKFRRYTYNPSQPNQLSRTKLAGPFDHITFITEDADKKIWIGTLQNGIVRYDPVSRQVTHFGGELDKKGVLKDETSWWANATPDGFVWISTQRSNLFRADIYSSTIPFYGKTAVANPDRQFADAETTYSFQQDGDSVLWIGTNGGLVRRDLKRGNLRKFINEPANDASLSDNVVYSLAKEKSGDLWVGTSNGFNYFNQKTGKFTRYYPDSAHKRSASNAIFKLCLDSLSNLWLGTYGGGLYFFERSSGKFINYNSSADTNTISGGFVSALMIDANYLWIGTDNTSGMNKMDLKTKRCTRYLPGLSISSVYKDDGGTVWVGNEGGLYEYNRVSDAFNSSSVKNPGSNILQVRGITADNENNLWMSTEGGIFMMSKKRDHVMRFGKDYGVPETNNVFYYGSAFTAHDGKIYFGNVQGYYSFSPGLLKMSVGEPKLYFTALWVHNNQVQPASSGILKQSLFHTKEIRLRHDQNVISFTAASVDFRNVDKRIHYKLENYDPDWRIAQSDEKITYFKVPPGSYTLRIKTPDEINNDWLEKTIRIVIFPPWWATWWAYCIYGILLAVLGFFIHRYQRARVIKTEREKARVKELAQAKEIEKAYHELKTTQTQLIQSEKMASLGELTAGIAHEIQNPLNFVNNFSEVNKELLTEMSTALDKGNYSDAKAIARDVISNEEKVGQHGKRADAIVKGMLQHSRTSSGQKELTDINTLVDEYLRLAYHGLRAKDKSFNAKFEADLDPSVGTIPIVQQDIGRVILNLLNNAFYAVNERWKTEGERYEPTVIVSTKRSLSFGEGRGEVLISVKDNGNGIPKNIVDKIFQPFFTTKPAGQGTGLGLSLAYDIVKAHGGEIRVETKEGEGSEFVIQLPATSDRQ